MAEEQKGPLVGMCVAFTGRGMAFDRSQAQRIVESAGGRFQLSVTPETNLLVLGAAGWPLQKNGRLTKDLEMARYLRAKGENLEIESEEDFLYRVGIESAGGTQSYTLSKLARLSGLSIQQLTAWQQTGLLCPGCYESGVAQYDYTQVVRCRTLSELSSTKTGRKRLARLIKHMRENCIEDSILDRLVSLDSRPVVRGLNGVLHETNGQRLFDFCDNQPQAMAFSCFEQDDAFERAVELELSGSPEEAERAYRQILEDAPDDVDALYNLANLLVEQQRLSEAADFYRDAVYYDPEFVEAWNNLGNVLLDLGHNRAALIAYRQALRVTPDFPPALFGLAVGLEDCGRPAEAISYWQAYLSQEPVGERAEYAKRRLHSD